MDAMAITISGETMTEESSGHYATWQPDPDGPGGGAWTSTRLPGARLTYRQAYTSLALAEVETAGYADSPNAAGLRAALGI